MIGWSIAIVLYLTGLLMASSYYPQEIDFNEVPDDNTLSPRATQLALAVSKWTTLLLWPVVEIYSAYVALFRKESEEEGE